MCGAPLTATVCVIASNLPDLVHQADPQMRIDFSMLPFPLGRYLPTCDQSCSWKESDDEARQPGRRRPARRVGAAQKNEGAAEVHATGVAQPEDGERLNPPGDVVPAEVLGVASACSKDS